MEYHRILVIRLSAMGDVIRTLPAVKALKKRYPLAHLSWLVEEPSEALLKGQPEIDEVIVLPRKRWTEGVKSPMRWVQTLGEIKRFAQNLKNREFEVALDFHGLLKSGLISYFSGAPRRVGFHRPWSREGNLLFSNVRVSLPKEKLRKINRYEQNLALLKGIGLEVRDVPLGLSISPADREYADSFFRNVGASLRRPLIAIHPWTSSKTPYKRWLPERYAQVADRFIAEMGATVMFTWGPDELNSVEAIRKKMNQASILGPKTESLTQLAEIFGRCDLYIGGDTGPMHIASLMGTPVVALFGPTYPSVNAPIGPHRMVRKDVGCNPCREQSCEEVTCMRAITADEVFDAARDLLGAMGSK